MIQQLVNVLNRPRRDLNQTLGNHISGVFILNYSQTNVKQNSLGLQRRHPALRSGGVRKGRLWEEDGVREKALRPRDRHDVRVCRSQKPAGARKHGSQNSYASETAFGEGESP